MKAEMPWLQLEDDSLDLNMPSTPKGGGNKNVADSATLIVVGSSSSSSSSSSSRLT